jgi:hypothetical protein
MNTPAVTANFLEVESAPTITPYPARSTPPVQTAESFLARRFPPKESLIEGLLNRRDIVAFAGRRRHGKTTFLSGLATAASMPLPEFLGYSIPKALRVLVFFLEDDAEEIQTKLRVLMDGGSSAGRLAVYTREDFQQAAIPVDLSTSSFRDHVIQICKLHRPDIVVFDNLAHLVGADYSNPKKIHELMTFVYKTTSASNAAVIIAAHPRKRGGDSDSLSGSASVSLRLDSEAFFENVMGSSHFINSCGSLWGIERDIKTNQTEFLGGTQRADGQEMLLTLEVNDGRFRVLDDVAINFPLAMNTELRKRAWDLLPNGDFMYTAGELAVKSVMKSSSTFNGWFKQLKQLKLVVVGNQEGAYRKVSL